MFPEIMILPNNKGKKMQKFFIRMCSVLNLSRYIE